MQRAKLYKRSAMNEVPMTNDDIPADNPLPVREVGEPLAWIPRPSASPHTPEYAP
jgi:hypothetical protein